MSKAWESAWESAFKAAFHVVTVLTFIALSLGGVAAGTVFFVVRYQSLWGLLAAPPLALIALTLYLRGYEWSANL